MSYLVNLFMDITGDKEIAKEIRNLAFIYGIEHLVIYKLGDAIYSTVAVIDWNNCAIYVHGYGQMYDSDKYFEKVYGFIKVMGKDFTKWETCKNSCRGAVVIPDGVLNIAENFMSITGDFVGGLTKIVIGQSVKYIGKSAFENWYSQLTEVVINPLAEIQELGDRAFYGNNKLKEIDFYGTVEVVGSSCFAECTSLEVVNLSNNIRELRGHTFRNCYKLRKFNSYNQVNYLHESAFTNACFERCNSLDIISFADTVDFADNNTPGQLLYVDLFSGKTCDEDGYMYTTIVTNNIEAINRNWKENDHRVVTFEAPRYNIFVLCDKEWIRIPVSFNLEEYKKALDINVNGARGKVAIYETDGDGIRHVAFMYNDKWYWLEEA